ncbi:MAG: hypothetical protein FWD71_19650 [Oscillospiraceae bacterium]|nr:hypothetical protein [Oscillospiraceae bacterium]
MARPKKLESSELIRLVEMYYESHGNPDKLKCSMLEEYAISLGFNVKAYDFRRDAAVRKRIEELRLLSDGVINSAMVYKSLDVDALINCNYTKTMLKNSILELDETWRNIYERATVLTKENAALMSEIARKEREIKMLNADKDAFETREKSTRRDLNALMFENRYLRKSLKEYLYPAVANEILKREHILEQTDTYVLPQTMTALADTDMPSSFSASIAADNDLTSREAAIIKRMEEQICGNGNAQGKKT